VDGLLVLFPIFAPTHPEKVRVYSSPSRPARHMPSRMAGCD
jgi:hypothetical protein